MKRGWASLVSIVVPSIYLCWVDTFALREGIWHITEKYSLEIFVVPDLPIEEATFFTIINLLIVIATAAFDKSKSILDLYPNLYPVKPTLKTGNFFSYLKQTLRAFLTAECNLPREAVDDLRASISVLERGSKSFTAAASAFDPGRG